MLPNKSVCSNSSLFDIFQPVLFGQCYGVKGLNEEVLLQIGASNFNCAKFCKPIFLFRWAFDIYDEDNSGMIDQKEMDNVMTVGHHKIILYFYFTRSILI